MNKYFQKINLFLLYLRNEKLNKEKKSHPNEQ